MVRHTTKAVNSVTISFNTLLYQQVKVVSIIVIEKYILSPIASHHHMIETSSYMDSEFFSHGVQHNNVILVTQLLKPAPITTLNYSGQTLLLYYY